MTGDRKCPRCRCMNAGWRTWCHFCGEKLSSSADGSGRHGIPSAVAADGVGWGVANVDTGRPRADGQAALSDRREWDNTSVNVKRGGAALTARPRPSEVSR